MISSKKDLTKDLTIYTCTGFITAEELRNTIIEYYQGKPTRDAIWDFTESEFSFSNADDIKQLMRDTKTIVHSREGGKTAIVCFEDFAFAVCRLYQSCAEAEDYSIPVTVFRTIQEAESWIFGVATDAPSEVMDHKETER